MTVFFDSLVLPIAWAGTRSRVALKVFDKFQMSILPLRINNRWTEVTPPSVFLHAVFAFSSFFPSLASEALSWFAIAAES